MKAIFAVLTLFVFSGLAAAQQSSSFQLAEYSFNAGGHPEEGAVLFSPSYRMTLDTLGESLVRHALVSASYGMDGGFISAYPPPGEVRNLRFSDATVLTWEADPSIGSYNLYRDPLHALPGLEYGHCEQPDIKGEAATDATEPQPGTGLFYLITAKNRLAEEGTKGRASSNEERANASPCP